MMKCGLGNLNLYDKILILNNIIGCNFIVEYHLEYRFSKDHPSSSV